MRELLFRAKAINCEKYGTRTQYENGDWVYGLVSRLGSEKYNLPVEMTNFFGTSGIEVERNTLGQSIGLIDKNKKNVFEHDIVKVYDLLTNRYFIGVVKYFYGSFYIYDTDFRSNYRWMDYEIEVIGNIYDNIELIGGSQNDRSDKA